MSRTEDVNRALLTALSKGGSLRAEDEPDAWETLHDAAGAGTLKSQANSLGLLVFNSKFDLAYHVIPEKTSSVFALKKEEACAVLNKLASAQMRKSGGDLVSRAIWSIIFVLFVDWAFDRKLQPDCLSIECPPVSDFTDNLDRRLKSYVERYRDRPEDAPDLVEACEIFMNRPAARGDDAGSDRAATTTRAAAVNAMLRFLADQGYLVRKELDAGNIKPTDRFCAIYQFGIASMTTYGALRDLLESGKESE